MQAAVRARLSENKRYSVRNTKHDYLLRALVTCGECGWKMACTRQRSVCKRYEYFYYGCGTRAPVDTGQTHRCSARSVRASELDAVVWNALREWLQHPEMLAREIDAWHTSHFGSTELEREQAHVERVHRQLRTHIDRLVDAYVQGAIDVGELKARRERLDALLEAQEVRQRELAARQQQQTRLAELTDSLSAFAATVRQGLTALSFAERQQLVRLLVERVVVKGDDVTIEHAVPLSGRFSGMRLGNRGVSSRLEARALPRRRHAAALA
jgi:site-specific DNA recombinase